MFLELDQWHVAYDQIREDCFISNSHGSSSKNSVLILCHPDADALAAARIWSYMFRNDSVPHQLLPCRSWKQLQQQTEAFHNNNNSDNNNIDSSTVCAVILLNLGANKNLTQLKLFLSPSSVEDNKLLEDVDGINNNHSNTKIYVMDCRRPVHLANVYAESNVVVFWDSLQHPSDAVMPSDGDDLSGNESSSVSSSENDDADDSDDDDNSLDSDQDNQEHEFEMDLQDKDVSTQGADQEQDTDYDGEDEKDDQDRQQHHQQDDDSTVQSPKMKKQFLTELDTLDKLNQDDAVDTRLNDTALTEASTPPHPFAPSMTPRDLHSDRRRRLRQYYAHGSYYGYPAAYAAYRLASQSRFHDVGDLLWLACVGVTDAYLHARLDRAGYSALVLQLRDTCDVLYPNDEFTRIRNTVYAEQLLRPAPNAQQQRQQRQNNNNNHTTGALTKIAFTGNGRILAETDFRFFLLRHTSLYEAMQLSDYVSTQLQLPTAKGLHKLQEMLAQMGFPLLECQQPFCFMKPKLRRQLRTQLLDHMQDYNLEHLEFTSFFRVTGYQSLLSASDTSYAITALLECGGGAADDQDDNDSNNDNKDDADERRLLRSFYTALAALAPTASGDGNSTSLANLVNGVSLASTVGLGAGLKLALQLQKSIIATANSLMNRNAITRLSHFRYAYITTTPPGEGGVNPTGDRSSESSEQQQQQHAFAHPLALTRLAHYLMDWNRANGKWSGTNQSRPLVLLAEQPPSSRSQPSSQSSFLVVGCEYPEAAGDVTRNRFGHYFELVAQSLQGHFVLDSFDAHVVQVGRSDAQRFLEQLHYLLDRMNE